jgi:ATP-dependent Lon protease
VLPKRNEGDLEDVPEQVREQIAFHVAEDLGDVLEVALRSEAAPAASGAAA